MKPSLSFKHVLLGTTIAAVASAITNNIWLAVFNATAINSVSHIIHIGSVTGASIMPLVLGGLVYFTLQKFMVKGTTIYVSLAVVFGLLSCFGAFQPTLPDGTITPANFAYLSVPMHLIATTFAALIPRFSARFSA